MPGLSAPAPPRATLPGSTGRKPSGIPAAAVLSDRGALVSSGFPSQRSLGECPAPPAKSALSPGTAICSWECEALGSRSTTFTTFALLTFAFLLVNSLGYTRRSAPPPAP